MLLAPHTDLDFSLVGLGYFVGYFYDLYDREELEEYLNEFDPNDPVQLKFLLGKFFFPVENRDLTIQHKIVLVNMLKEKLLNPKIDFAFIFQEDEEEGRRFPSEWNILNPRAIFKQIYRFLLEEWGNQLTAAGYDFLPLELVP